ncbi:hypothetical protein RHO13_09340 [Orbus wheelerorum]|uniref:right-handed parallel beta-helix repeat-containing protein n=1 Tax=Orbus wheelerorum TaxID=3074111 RepID=UPI00370D3D35
MKRLLISFISLVIFNSSAVFAQEWKAIAFGQSTDLNFASLIKPEKVGVNNVLKSGENDYLSPDKSYALPADFTIESRGGKIANSHDGMTIFYTQLPVNQTFSLESDVTLVQIGPEVDGKTPAAQEAAGLFVRDIIGEPRRNPQPDGFEEFPNASNVIMNAFITQNQKNDNLVKITALVREGVEKSWGNEGISISKTGYVENINYHKVRNIHLTITRTPQQFILTQKDALTGEVKAWSINDYSGFMDQQDTNHIYVGFFASRNANVQFQNSFLTLHNELVDYQILPKKQKVIIEVKPSLALSSAKEAYRNAYTLQFLPNVSGNIFIKEINQKVNVLAGEMVQVPVKLAVGKNTFTINFANQVTTNQQLFTINLVESNIENLLDIIVSPQGNSANKGTIESPVDFATAVKTIQPNGTIHLMDGLYDGLTIPLSLSGLPNQLKTIEAMNKYQAIFINNTFNLDGNYWSINKVVFDGNIDGKENKPAYLRISGSHNLINQVITRNNSDTGLAISTKNKNRLFWPAYNLVINCDSYNNMDKSGKNADGFAAKLGVGKGNVFKGCISHNNTDDGFDLYNKIEDGPNEAVLIDGCVTYLNGFPFSKPNIAKGSIGNGFKLGAEGQPVDHKIINSIALNNNMDGFTDNFNTGSYIIDNNIAINSARYNYILRANPYLFLKPSILFKNNYSIKDSWQNSPKDSFGPQVNILQYSVLTTKDLWKNEVKFIFTRDDDGNIILPSELKTLMAHN